MRARFISMLIAFAALLGTLWVQTPSAYAAQHNDIRLLYNANLRSAPAADGTLLTVMPANSSPDYLCYIHSQSVTIGQGYTDLWFKAAYSGQVGYYSSVFDDVPLSRQHSLELYYGIGDCRLVGESNDPIVWLAQNTTFNRSASASWALAHAQDRQPFTFSACTWFVSQALWAGGFTQSENWNSVERHGSAGYLPGTPSATAAPALIAYLKSGYSVSEVDLDFTPNGNSVSLAQPGDIVEYSWNDKDGFTIDHLALVVNVLDNGYMEVSEWGTITPPDYFSDYVKRGFSWSVNSNTWLQYAKGVTFLKGKLLHFNF